MAEAVIGATIQVSLEAVISFASTQIGLLRGFDREVESLRDYAITINDLLADAEARQEQEPAVKSWLKTLEGVAFDADHLLDELNYEILRRKVKSRNQLLKGKVCFFFSFSSANTAFRSRMASKVRDIQSKLGRINQRARDLGLTIRHHITPTLLATAAVSNVVGREEDELTIVEMLLSTYEQPVSVIPIFGMGGIGKTTLVQSLYNNPQICSHFNKRIWICVAKKIEIIELFQFILECSTGEKVEGDRREAIVQKIRNELWGKRYFLVLDDVWNDEHLLWDDFFTTLKELNTTNGSCCLVTTRLEQVANAVSRVDPYKLEKLSEDECWSILKQKVIVGEDVPKELKAIKKQILRRCAGVPLAAILIGGLLCQKRKEEWQSIVEERLLIRDQYSIMPILKVSFDHLSPSVKKCFAYCSIFSKDTELKKDLLIELWMAEGFLQPDPTNNKSMEDIGDMYFRILLQSSLLEEVQGWWWIETYYKMHDLVHDFAKSVLNEDRYLALNSFEGTAENIKKISTSVRTLFLGSGISIGMLSKFEYLHVLKLFGADVNELPTFIGKLIHLRLLDISDSEIKIFPESFGKLYNLQTLRIDDGTLDSAQGGFPKQMKNLISLRHLHYYDSSTEFQMPLEIGRLTCLQTLKFFNVGKEKGCGIEELGSLKDLKGKLVIRNLELVNGKQVAEQAKLSEKPNLYKLVFEWGSQDRDGDNCEDDVLEGLQPHRNLKEFVIRNFMGENCPQWLMNLPTLMELELTNCNRLIELPALGQLPCLEELTLTKMEKIECMGVSFYGININDKAVMPRKFFPALKSLYLEDMENLEEWKGAEEVRSATGEAQVILFPVLEKLIIKECSKLTSAPYHDFPSIEELEISNCHVSLVENIVSNITTLWEVVIDGDDTDEVDDPQQHILRLNLQMPRGKESCLRLQGCGSEMIAHLCPSLTHLCYLPSLQYLDVRDCHVSLAKNILSNITTLSILKLMDDDMDEVNNIRRLELEIPHGKLKLEGFGNLPYAMIERLCYFSSLQRLHVSSCPNLTSLRIGCSTCLEKLKLSDCENLRELPEDLYKCQALQKLHISHCPKINQLVIPVKGQKSLLTSLEELGIWDCDGFTSLPLEMLQSCTSLRRMEVVRCPNLITNMPKGFAFLTSLEELGIGPFADYSSINEFDWNGLRSSSILTKLVLYGSPGIHSLPDQLQCLTTLTELQLRDFGIEALPDCLANLGSLETLVLQDCKRLQSLFSEDARSRPTKLTSLHHPGCTLLQEKLIESKISKIPPIPDFRVR